jgi:hypothetical protein
MAYELGFWPPADAAMKKLEDDPAMSSVLAAVNRILDRLERDPFDPRLSTRAFVSQEYGGVNATAVREGDWYVLWQRGPDATTIDVILVHELAV